MTTLRVVRFDENRREDFRRLHSDANGAGWCRCVAWWVPTWEGWGERSAAENGAFRDSLCDAGHYDGYLAYDSAEPVGWCQAGPRDRLEKLVTQLGLHPDPAVWAITCFLVAPSHRRRGVARALLRHALADLGARGVARVEAYPRAGTGLDEGDLWTGPAGLFVDEGFRHAGDSPRGPVLARDL
jgi:ribosomal protein S18 acetylase RimI-like enzyme